MSHFCDRLSKFQLPGLPISISILGVFALSTMPGRAADDDFSACVAGLIAAGIETSASTAACGASRYPGKLAACVTNVNTQTGISAEEALSVCERSRRPDEVASCTVRIHDSLLSEPSLSALDHCGRSLLPERYATCVVDFNEVADLAADEAMSRCIRAGYRPWEIAPRL
jgi:hypothetical protein